MRQTLKPFPEQRPLSLFCLFLFGHPNCPPIRRSHKIVSPLEAKLASGWFLKVPRKSPFRQARPLNLFTWTQSVSTPCSHHPAESLLKCLSEENSSNTSSPSSSSSAQRFNTYALASRTDHSRVWHLQDELWDFKKCDCTYRTLCSQKCCLWKWVKRNNLKREGHWRHLVVEWRKTLRWMNWMFCNSCHWN